MNIIRLNSIGEPFAKSGQATPPSGGGTEASSMEYLDISSLSKTRKMMFLNLCVVAKFAKDIISPFAYMATYQTDLATTATDATMVAIDFGAKVYNNDTLLTTKEMLLNLGYTEETLAAIPRLTEEQFYTL